MHPDFAGRMGEHSVPVCQFYTKHRVWQVFFTVPSTSIDFFLCHSASRSVTSLKISVNPENLMLHRMLAPTARSDFRFAVGDRERVLEVGGEAAVHACAPSSCPASRFVRQSPTLTIGSMAMTMPGRRSGRSPGTVVRDLRVLVHLAADAVADVLADDREALAFDVGLDGCADLADPRAGAGGADATPERLSRDIDQPLRLGRDVADADGDGRCRRRSPCACSRGRC